MLDFQSVKKAYGPNTIIDISSKTVAAGLYWLQGGNGAGKSTLMKLIAGMIPFEGNVKINDVDLRETATEYRRLVNYVEAEPLYPPFLTGNDLIHFSQSIRKADADQVFQLRKLFKVDAFEKNPINTYSSGMVKRLSLVLAFIGSPKLILLDEPLVTIDKDAIPILYGLISKSIANGVSFIVASHQPLDALALPPIASLKIVDHELVSL